MIFGRKQSRVTFQKPTSLHSFVAMPVLSDMKDATPGLAAIGKGQRWAIVTLFALPALACDQSVASVEFLEQRVALFLIAQAAAARRANYQALACGNVLCALASQHLF
jgi:hypothetical protein